MTYTLRQYQIDASAFKNNDLTNRDTLLMCVLGISSESGEIAEAIKHNLYHGHPLDKENLKKELGDMLWYVSQLAEHMNWNLDEVADLNIIKLRLRYPEGFSKERSINREERIGTAVNQAYPLPKDK